MATIGTLIDKLIKLKGERGFHELLDVIDKIIDTKLEAVTPTFIHRFENDSAYLEVAGNDLGKTYNVLFLDQSNNALYNAILKDNTWSLCSEKTYCIRVYDSNWELMFEQYNPKTPGISGTSGVQRDSI